MLDCRFLSLPTFFEAFIQQFTSSLQFFVQYFFIYFGTRLHTSPSYSKGFFGEIQNRTLTISTSLTATNNIFVNWQSSIYNKSSLPLSLTNV